MNVLYSDDYITITSQTTSHAPINMTQNMVSKALFVNSIERQAPQHSSDPVNESALVCGIDQGQSEESGTMHRTYLVKRSSKAGRILALPPSACSPLPELVRLLCAHPTGFVERLTNYEAHNFVAPRSSSLNLILCELNGLGDVQTMKVDHHLTTILRQRTTFSTLSADI